MKYNYAQNPFHKLLIVIFAQFIQYILLFVVIPAFFMKGMQDIIWITIAMISVIGISLFAMTKYRLGILDWLSGILVMWGAILCYHKECMYGIGNDTGFGLDFFPAYIDALIFALGIFIVQAFLWGIKNIFQHIREHKS